MAKKKLTPYQQARRDFVQARVQARGIEGTPEERKQIRQRFDVLAQTKEGRGKIARNVLPTGQPEERKNFKRLLSTELPARNVTGTGGGGGGAGGGTKSKYAPTNAQSITNAWQGAVQSGAYKVPTPAKSPKNIVTQSSTTNVGKKTESGNLWSNRKNNFIGQGINYPGRQTIEGFLNPLGSKGGIKDFSVGGLAKTAAKEFGEAAILVGSAKPLSYTARKVVQVGRLGSRYGGMALQKLFPGGKQPGTNRFGGVGKEPYGPTRDNLSPLAIGPGKPSTAPKPATTKPATTKPSGTKPPTVRMNKQGGVGSQKYGPAAPTKPATTTKPASTTKPATTKPATTKPASTKGPRISRQDADDVAYSLTQAKNRFPGFREGDAPFVQKLNRAQETIEKNAPGASQYAQWLKNPQTQATLRRLRKK